MIEVIHKQCGHLALLAHRALDYGEVITADNFQRLDGSEFKVGELMMCGQCGAAMAACDFTFGAQTDGQVTDCSHAASE